MLRYSERVWAEVDPSTADRLRETDAEVARASAAVASLKRQVDAERESQERLLQDFRHKGHGYGAPQLLPTHAQFQQPPQPQPQQQQQQQQQRVPNDRRGVRPTSASLYGADPRDRRG